MQLESSDDCEHCGKTSRSATTESSTDTSDQPSDLVNHHKPSLRRTILPLLGNNGWSRVSTTQEVHGDAELTPLEAAAEVQLMRLIRCLLLCAVLTVLVASSVRVTWSQQLLPSVSPPSQPPPLTPPWMPPPPLPRVPSPSPVPSLPPPKPLAPPTSPPPSQPPLMLHILNAQFRDGSPSNELDRAGVVVYQFDTLADDNQPWLPRCYPNCDEEDNRFSASVMWGGMPKTTLSAYWPLTDGQTGMIPLFNPWEPGLVLKGQRSQPRCSYTLDTGSIGTHAGCGVSFCDPNTYRGWTYGSCAWPSKYTKEMLKAYLKECQDGQCGYNPTSKGYNELILEGGPLVDHLPDSVEAIFVPVNQRCRSKCQDRARRFYEKFQQTFGQRLKHVVPLLGLNTSDWVQPFVPCPGLSCVTPSEFD